MAKKENVEVRRVDSWYKELIQDIRKLEYTGIVITKHAIGKRILQDELKFGKPEYGSRKIEGLAKELDIPKRELWLCVQFAKKCDTVTQFKGESWRNITHNILPEPREKVGYHSPAVIYEDVVCSLRDLIEQGKKFKTIYADPPWSYGNQGTRAATSNHYTGMTVEEICELPIKDLVEEESHLHLWTTNAFLFEAKRVMETWGFEYKSVMLWIKPQMGIGNYWRVCHEFLLFGNRNKLPMLDAHTTLRSWYEIDRTRHSVKPQHFRSLIEQVSPPPRLELFAREAHDGWAAYGNEILGAEMWKK